jgi:hypothetical protein
MDPPRGRARAAAWIHQRGGPHAAVEVGGTAGWRNAHHAARSTSFHHGSSTRGRCTMDLTWRGPHVAVLVGRARQGGADPPRRWIYNSSHESSTETLALHGSTRGKSREPPLRAEGRAGERKAWCGSLAGRRRGRWEEQHRERGVRKRRA